MPQSRNGKLEVVWQVDASVWHFVYLLDLIYGWCCGTTWMKTGKTLEERDFHLDGLLTKRKELRPLEQQWYGLLMKSWPPSAQPPPEWVQKLDNENWIPFDMDENYFYLNSHQQWLNWRKEYEVKTSKTEEEYGPEEKSGLQWRFK